MSVEFDKGSPGKFDSRTLNRETLNRWTGRMFWGGAVGFRSGTEAPLHQYLTAQKLVLTHREKIQSANSP